MQEQNLPCIYQGLTQIETPRDKPWGFSIYAVVFKGGNGYNCTRQIPAKGRPPAQEKGSIRGMPGRPGGSGNWTKGAKRKRGQFVQSARHGAEPGAAGRVEVPVTGSGESPAALEGGFQNICGKNHQGKEGVIYGEYREKKAAEPARQSGGAEDAKG